MHSVAGCSSVTRLSIFYGDYLLGYLSSQLFEEAKLDLSRVPGSQERLSERAPTRVPSEEDGQEPDKPPPTLTPWMEHLLDAACRYSALQFIFPSGVNSQLLIAVTTHALKRLFFPRPLQFVGLGGGQPQGFPGDTVVKNLPANAEDARGTGLTSGLGRSPGEGSGNPLQYSCLENSMDRGAWQATVHRVAKSWTRLSTLAWWGDLNPKAKPHT